MTVGYPRVERQLNAWELLRCTGIYPPSAERFSGFLWGEKKVARQMRTCVHEAGHATVGLFFGAIPEEIDVSRWDGGGGSCLLDIPGDLSAKDTAAINIAGNLADHLWFGRYVDVGPMRGPDLKRVAGMSEPEFQLATNKAAHILIAQQAFVVQLASALYEREILGKGAH